MCMAVPLTNLENVLQRILRIDKAREYIFRASGVTNFEIFSCLASSGVRPMYRPAAKNSGYVIWKYFYSSGVDFQTYLEKIQGKNLGIELLLSYIHFYKPWRKWNIEVF